MIGSAQNYVKEIKKSWNDFFHSQLLWPIPDLLRIGYALLLLINFSVLGLDLEMFYSESGVLPYASALTFIGPHSWTLFGSLPKTDGSMLFGFAMMYLHLLGLLIGWKSRLNAIAVFIWLVSFQHRNPLLFDGEDTLFRLLGFLLIFMPIGRRWTWKKRSKQHPLGQKWALRLFQIQMTLIYFSTAILKLKGEDWRMGHALHYVVQLDDLFGRFPLPDVVLKAEGLWLYASWGVVAFELFLAVGLWIKPLRPYAICLGILFHLCLDYAMNLFLFQWLMILGLISFVGPEEWQRFRTTFSTSRSTPLQAV